MFLCRLSSPQVWLAGLILSSSFTKSTKEKDWNKYWIIILVVMIVSFIVVRTHI